MSKIGKKVIPYLQKYNFINIKYYKNYQKLNILSPFGYNSINVPKQFNIKVLKNKVIVEPKIENKVINKKVLSLWGLYNRKINNLLYGLNNLHMLKLELRGVGFKGEIKKNKLVLNLGFSHSITINIPEHIEVYKSLNKLKQNTHFIIFSINKQKLYEFAKFIINHKIRDLYKGKGIFFENESIILKEGKRQNS